MATGIRDKVAIIGMGCTKFGERWDSSTEDLILEAFEELGWPESIDDPLPVDHDIDPKRRLHDAIKRLNRNQQCAMLSFHGNGNGEGIVYRLHAHHKSSAPKAAPVRP